MKRGLASKRDGAENNRNKIIYSITEDGRNYLKGWLANPVEKDELRYETLLNYSLVMRLERSRHWRI